MAACGVGNGGAAGGGVAVITGKDDVLGAMNRKRELPSHDRQHRSSEMASGHESRLVVGRASLVSSFADIVIVCVLGLVVLLLYLFGEPYQRGFFCDDDSIRFSYKSDTVSSAVLVTCSICIPSFVVVLSEIVVAKRQGLAGQLRRIAVGPCTLPVRFTRIVWILALFIFGLGAQQVIVDAGKYSVGRLRPHFLDACQPSPSVAKLCGNGSLSAPPPNAGIFYVPFAAAPPHAYITNFECTGPSDMVREARLSFPSGHSSLSFYAAVFIAVFLWRRFHWRPRARLQLAFAQLVPVMMAWLTALSRISDHKHHWSDVLSGALIGSVVAAITVYTSVKRVPPKTEESENESTYVFGDRAPHAVIVDDTPPATA